MWVEGGCFPVRLRPRHRRAAARGAEVAGLGLLAPPQRRRPEDGLETGIGPAPIGAASLAQSGLGSGEGSTPVPSTPWNGRFPGDSCRCLGAVRRRLSPLSCGTRISNRPTALANNPANSTLFVSHRRDGALRWLQDDLDLRAESLIPGRAQKASSRPTLVSH